MLLLVSDNLGIAHNLIVNFNDLVGDIFRNKGSSSEDLQVSAELVVRVPFCVFNVLLKAQVGIDRLVDLHQDNVVHNDSKDNVASKVVHKHVVSHCDLMLSCHKIEDSNEWHDVIHAQGC